MATAHGEGRLTRYDALGATVSLSGVMAGDLVVVRTNYFPAWLAASDGRPIGLFASDGQLAFRAPRDGSYDVTLTYPRRPWLLAGAMVCVVVGAFALSKAGRRREAAGDQSSRSQSS